MRFERCFFGSIRIDRVTYNHDVVIDRDKVPERKKKASKKFREAFGHTPLFAEVEAKRRKIELLLLPTAEAIAYFDEPQPVHFVPHAEYLRPNTDQGNLNSVPVTLRTWPPDRIRRTIGAGENGGNV